MWLWASPRAMISSHGRKPYYRSTYVFVYPKDSEMSLKSLDDPILRTLKIGVHLLGNDYMNPPRSTNWENEASSRTSSGLIPFIRRAIPLERSLMPLQTARLMWLLYGVRWPAISQNCKVCRSNWCRFLQGRETYPSAFDICLGVRHGEKELKARLEAVLDRKSAEISAILNEYGVPTLPLD